MHVNCSIRDVYKKDLTHFIVCVILKIPSKTNTNFNLYFLKIMKLNVISELFYIQITLITDERNYQQITAFLFHHNYAKSLTVFYYTY